MENDADNIDLSKIHVCLDMTLPPNMALEAADRAITENPENAPSGTVDARRKIGIRPETFGAVLTGKKWKNGRVLRVRHLNGDAAIHRKVEDLARMWEDHANIHFEFVAKGDAEIRIGYAADNLSWSYLGTDALSVESGQETMHYGWLTPTTPFEEMRRVVVHEFGHALGMIHEHQHPSVEIKWNKPVVYRHYKEKQGWDKVTVDSNLFAHYSDSETQFSNYDPTSIMHYPVPAEFTLDGVAVGWNTDLSDTDKQFIAEAYPKVPEHAAADLPAFAAQELTAANTRVQRDYGV